MQYVELCVDFMDNTIFCISDTTTYNADILYSGPNSVNEDVGSFRVCLTMTSRGGPIQVFAAEIYSEDLTGIHFIENSLHVGFKQNSFRMINAALAPRS